MSIVLPWVQTYLGLKALRWKYDSWCRWAHVVILPKTLLHGHFRRAICCRLCMSLAK